jgi:hypothetical protein
MSKWNQIRKIRPLPLVTALNTAVSSQNSEDLEVGGMNKNSVTKKGDLMIRKKRSV